MHIISPYKLTTCFLFVLISPFAHAQNIYGTLHLNDEREYKTARPKKIIETSTFYGTTHNEKSKSIKTFDKAGMLLTEEHFDNDNKLNSRRTRINDTVNRLILSSIMESWTILGKQFHTITYQYNNRHFLERIIYKNAAGNVFDHYEIINNEYGNPIEISGFAADGSPYGKQTATYLYDKNKAVTSVIKSDGTVLNTDTMTIDFTKNTLLPGEGLVFNPQGDLTSWTSEDYKENKTYYEATLTYDSHRNCTNKTTYEVSIGPNGKRKRQIHSTIKKEYVY